VGRPVHGVEVVVLGDDVTRSQSGRGELLVRGWKVSPGYVQRPDEMRERYTQDGWLRTGDEATIGADGYVFIHGRTDDQFISGGLNIQPAEVELALASHPRVRECAAFGVPSTRWGSACAVAVVLDVPGITLDEIKAFLRPRIDSRKLPKSVWEVARLPRNRLGKLDRQVLARSLDVYDGEPADISHRRESEL
jgi:acyl-CoA synthetase (AMP-forming)/AMP-acid ligase II